ncbi:MAG TPA: hypothetical protein VGH31_03870, partial [Acidimicrobiales bacterium]
MSLRLRLLVAVGAIALVALVVADFATYSALRSSLYKQVDQSLAQNPLRLTRFIESGSCPSPTTGVFGTGNPASGNGGGDAGGNGGGIGEPPGGGVDGLGGFPYIEVRT